MAYTTANGVSLSVSGAVNSWISGTSGAETQLGTSGNDEFHAIGGDYLLGGAGDDTYYLWDTSETVVESAGKGVDTVMYESTGAPVLAANVENLFVMTSYVTGATGNALSNVIVAGSHGATLNGLGGDDVLVGGAGADIFKVVAGAGSDAIVNFTRSDDVVQLQGYGVTSFSGLMALGAQSGSDVKFSFANGEILVLRGTTLSSLSAYDFGLAPNAPTVPSGYLQMPGAYSEANGYGWYVFNNTWGSDALTYGADYTISSIYSPANLTQNTQFSWSYPLTTAYSPAILAYPEVVFGPSPLSGGIKTTDIGDVFPLKVSSISDFTIDYDLSYVGNKGGYDVAFDMWLTNIPGGGASTITNEVMVWLHKGDIAPFGDLVGTYSYAGDTAKIYVNHGAWTYTAVVFDDDQTAGTVDMADILAKLKGLGIVSSSEYFASVELGAEVVSGAGSLTVKTLDLAVTTTTASGATDARAVTGAGLIHETLTGTSAADSLAGGAGADLFIGGGGADTLDGGAGIDTVDYSGRTGSLLLTLNGSTDATAQVGGVSEDVVRRIENVIGTSHSDTIAGDSLANSLTGGAGDDSLVGGGGLDTLDGGGGVDTASYGSLTQAVAVTLHGSADATVYVDGVAQDTLRNIEVVRGGGGDDVFLGDNANDRFYGAVGDDSLVGGQGNDGLYGDAGADTLSGGPGQDTLMGGAGADVLTGGDGADTFKFAYASDSKPDAMDLIKDLTSVDVIDLSAIDANTSLSGGQAFSIVSAFSRAAGQLLLTTSGGYTVVSGDVNGDGLADFAFRVTGSISTTSNWVL